MEIQELISLNPRAWTLLLSKDSLTASTDQYVTFIEEIPLTQSLTRYLITLDKQNDPIPFVGKKTTYREAQFYREVSHYLPNIVPYCLYSHIKSHQNWILLPDVPNDYPSPQWAESQIQRFISQLANLHTLYWNKTKQLEAYSWLPYHVKPLHSEDVLETAPWLSLTSNNFQSHYNLSAQARRHIHALLPAFTQANINLQMLHYLGGWRHIITQKHLDAMTDLLDDPLPMLDPLRRLPSTLLHNSLSLHHCHYTLFDDCLLLDWSKVAIGPAVCDLVHFIESFDLIHNEDGTWQQRKKWALSAETIIDTYLLHLYENMWPLLNTRQIRQAIPAARCLYVITYWLPRFSNILELNKWYPLQDYFIGLFRRFLHAYRSL